MKIRIILALIILILAGSAVYFTANKYGGPKTGMQSSGKTDPDYEWEDAKTTLDVKSLAAALELCAIDNDGKFGSANCTSVSSLITNMYLNPALSNRDLNLKINKDTNSYITYALLQIKDTKCENSSSDPAFGDIRYAVYRSSTNKPSVECLKKAPDF